MHQQARMGELIHANHCMKQKDIALMTGISTERVIHIILEMLGCRKVCARWGPCVLALEMKHHRWQVCQELVAWYEQEGNAPIIQSISCNLWLLFLQAEGTSQGTPLRVWWWCASSCAYLFVGEDLRFVAQQDATTDPMLVFMFGLGWWPSWKIITLK